MASNQVDATPFFHQAATMFNMDPLLPMAVAQVESGGEPDPDRAVSSAGALGRMQIMPANLARMNLQNPNDPEQNITAGTSMLDEALTAAKGNVPLALRIYQGGTDQSKWGPANAAYPAKVGAAYQRLAAARAPSAPAADTTDSFLSGGGAPASPGPVQAIQAPAASSAATQAPTTLPAPANDDVDTFLSGTPPPLAPLPSYTYGQTGADAAAGYLAKAQAADASKSADQRVQEVLAPAPNTTYGSVLPFARDNTSGDVRIALPDGLRSLAQGAYDLSQGPSTGTVTPAGTMALAAALTGGIGASPAAGTGGALAQRLLPQGSAALGRNEVPDMLGAEFRAAPQLGMTNALTGGKPMAVPAPAVAVTEPPPAVSAVPGIQAPANPMTFPYAPPGATAPAPEVAVAPASVVPSSSGNALTGSPAVGAPPKPVMPIVTQSQAANHVDNLLAHFGQGGNTTPSPAGIAGAPPTLAQSTGNAGYAALENGLRSVDPHFNNLYKAQADIRADARGQAFREVAGTADDVDAAEQAREAATAQARDAAFANAQPVNPQPVVDQINSILSSPDGKRDAVVRSLTPFIDKLQSADGAGLETDPAQLYGVRKAINDKLAQTGTQEGADASAATRQLMQVRDALDSTIETGAPGFGAYIQQYSDMSRPIDAMRWLQSQNITDQLGNIQLGRLDSTVKRLQAQQAKPGSSLADSVTPEQAQQLTDLRDNMRQEAAVNKTMPVNSTTVQNLATSNLLAGAKGVADGATALGAVTLHPGAVLPMMARVGMNKLSGRGEALVQQELRNRLLNPLAGAPQPQNGLVPTP